MSQLTKPTATIPRLQQWLPITVVLCLAIGLYLFQLDTESLAWDEFFSIRDAKALNPDALRIRPIYYLLLHIWMQLGSGDAWLRGLSVLFSLGSVFLIYRLGRYLGGKITGLVSALMLTLSPYCIYNAQEVRMYMVSIFFGLTGSLFLSYALTKPTHKWMASWVVARWLALLTYPLNLFLLLADFSLIVGNYPKKRDILTKFAASMSALVIAWFPFANSLRQAASKFTSEWIEIVSPPSLKDAFFYLKIFTIRWWQLSPPANFLEQLGKFYLWGYTLMLLGLLIIAFLGKKRFIGLWWALIWWIVPLGSIFLISQGSESYWVHRYILFTSPYMMIVLAGGFAKLWKNYLQRVIAITVALVYIIAVIGGLTNYYTVQERTNWRDAVAVIKKQEQPQDQISVYAGIDPVSYYYSGKAPIYEIPPTALTVKEELTPEIIQAALDEMPPIQSRLWLVYRHRGSKARHPIMEKVIQKEFNVDKVWHFTGIDLFLLQNP